MSKRLVNLGPLKRLMIIGSYGRKAPGNPSMTPMAPRSSSPRGFAPEVMVKVTGGSSRLGGVRAHFNYIGRNGYGIVETDDGREMKFKGFEKGLVTDWDLDLVAIRRTTNRSVASGRKTPKLVHNLVFSMPRNTPVVALQNAVRKFGREEFGLKHRYAMTLHIDQSHPHVHMVVKAVSEESVRLNIRKATLREWRQQFAIYLREQGVEATATPRRERGLSPNYRTRNLKWTTMERAPVSRAPTPLASDRRPHDRGLEREM